MIVFLSTIQNNKEAILKLADKHGASNVRVFGSVARGDDRLDSDVDFLVSLPSGYDLFLQRMPLADQLASLLGRSVDLIPEHELNPHLRDSILSEAISL